LCGLVATVEDGKLVNVRGDKDNPLSRGFQCVKSDAMIEVVYDPDRLLEPSRRVVGSDKFDSVSWDTALDDIAARLRAIVDRYGADAVAVFHGNPPAFSYSSLLALDGFQRAIGTPYRYGINSEDGASRMAANAILYGIPTAILKPDLWRSHFALIIGANPYVSHGSAFSEPRVREALNGIVQRGGRVVVVDPRRTETARQFEHVGIRAGTDPWFLAALLREVLLLPIVETEFVERFVEGLDGLRQALEPFTPERAETASGIEAATIRDIARALHDAPSAFVYGRTGTCTQRFGTLNNLLQDLLCIVTGNVDRPGGLLWPWGPIDFTKFAEMSGMATYDSFRSRVRGLPEVIGMLPSRALAEDISPPGDDGIRAVIMVAGNPVLSSGGGGPELEAALERLDLFVALDLYVTETSKHAHYVLPTPTFFEREDLPLMWLGFMLRPTVFATDAVIDRIGNTRDEFEILDEIARRMGLGGAYSLKVLRTLARLGVRLKPKMLVDLLLRTSSAGDLFGLRRGGLSWNKVLKRHPHGVSLRPDLPVGVLAEQLRTADKRINAASPPLLEELRRLDDDVVEHGFPLRAHGMREARSQNTWMHNVPRLMPPSRRYAAMLHPSDAAAAGISEGDEAVISSPNGSLRVPVVLSNDMVRGNVALPHGWGHDGGWQTANKAGGANSNALVTDEVEALSAMSILNGIPVRVERAV
jgi:formate dehydrogenase